MSIAKTPSGLPRASETAVAAPNSGLVTVPLGRLKAGQTLNAPIYESQNGREVLLLAAQSRITSQVLQLLRQRGLTSVRVSASEVGRLTGVSTRSVVARAAEPIVTSPTTGGRFAVSSGSLLHQVTNHKAARYDRGQLATFAQDYHKSVGKIRGLFERIAERGAVQTCELAAVSSDSVDKITADLDLFVAMGARPQDSHDVSRHSTQVAMLAMSVGTVLGLKRDELIELGVGCLIHDSGMIALRTDVSQLDRKLTSLEFLEVTKHPAIAYDMLGGMDNVPTGARMVAYQMHERCDGSGYPRGRQAAQIHPLAKIAAVADVYVALVAERSWRPATLPYQAIVRILEDAKRGLFDVEVVRALVRTVSLFPIGSHVATSDGRVGTVLRTNREQCARPVVELRVPGRNESEIVDLAEAPEVQIARPIRPDEARPPALQLVSIPTYAVQPGDFWE